jgi:four helix bundle protein
MSAIKRFEDLKCWQNARELCKLVYLFTKKEKFCKDFTLVNQIRNSSGSGMDNMAEGFERGGNKEFHQAYNLSTHTGKETTNLIIYLRNSDMKGFKFSS